MNTRSEGSGSPKFALRLAADLLNEVIESVDSEYLSELLGKGDTNSLSGTTKKMSSLMKANKYCKDMDRKLSKIMEQCTTIARQESDVMLDDGTTPIIIQSEAFSVKGRLLMVMAVGVNVLKRKRTYRAAADFLQRSIDLSPSQTAYLNLGLCLTHLKRKADAVTALRKCIDLDPDSGEALQAGRELRGR